MPTMAELQVCSEDESMRRMKRLVYKQRVRLKEFLQDFDRLRSGLMHENHFISGLSLAGVDRHLSPQQIGTIVDKYRVRVAPSLSMIDWIPFVEDVEVVFATKGLERNPLATVPVEPMELLDKSRYRVCCKALDPEKEHRLARVVAALSARAAKRGIMVKPFFDDEARDPNSIRLVNHVTPMQFEQVLNSKLTLNVSPEDMELLIEKYIDDEYGDMVNYVVFAASVDPQEDAFDPYSLGH